MSKKKDINWLHELASLRGGRCLSVEYINNKTKYEWECDRGHGWEATADSVRQGKWCPECANCKRHNIEWLCELASLKGGKCLFAEYIDNKTKYEWECSQGHRFSMRANNVQRGQWCPRCSISVGADKRRHGIVKLQKLAKENNGKLLSEIYVNSHTKYKWECDKGHGWWATAGDVQQGHWCPTCFHKHSKSELQIYEFVKSLHPDTLSGQRKILDTPNFELDIYIPSLQKAIEFDGIFWHSRPGAKERDLRKNQECDAKGIKLLRIPEQDFLNCPQQVFDIVKVFLEGRE